MSLLVNTIVVLTATLDCNQRCPWCIRDKLNTQYNLPLDMMSVNTAKKIIESHKDITQVVATGGEPMLNKELMEYLFSCGQTVKVSTNGSIELWDTSLVEKGNVLFDISINSLTPPPLYTQLLEMEYPQQKIRGFVYLSDDEKKVCEIVEKISQDKIRGYEVLPDMWVAPNKEFEEYIKRISVRLGEIHKEYGKDHGYIQYVASETEHEPPCLKFKYSPQGERISDLWTQGLPQEIAKEKARKVFNDVNVMRYGHESFKKGIEGFNMPVEYYTSLMYEEMRKTVES